MGNKGIIHQSRSVKNYVHNCRFKCNQNFPEDKRQVIFEQYWNLASWNLQTAFITSCVEKIPPKRPQAKAQKHKNSSSILTLQGTRVCKEFFLRTLGISNKRYSNVVMNKSETNIAQTDRKGRHSPANKMQQSHVKFIEQHIKSFPKYSSHYSRIQNPNKKYLDSSLNLKKMYELYKEKCLDEKRVPVKLSYYRMIFNTRFNLSLNLIHAQFVMN